MLVVLIIVLIYVCGTELLLATRAVWLERLLLMRSATDIRRKYDLKLSSGNIKKHYYIDDSSTCSVEDKKIKQINVDITLPFDMYEQMDDFMCRIKKDLHECTYYFLRTQACLLKSSSCSSISTEDCLNIEKTFRCPYIP